MNARIAGQLERAGELHDRAMGLADEATILKLQGRQGESGLKLQGAFELERDAADLLGDADIPEPSRSVFHRSAASLAIQVCELDEAERLIEEGLRGQPPLSIAAELKELTQAIRGRLRTSERELGETPYEVERVAYFPKAFVLEVTASFPQPPPA